jgi:hypothetical protein
LISVNHVEGKGSLSLRLDEAAGLDDDSGVHVG